MLRVNLSTPRAAHCANTLDNQILRSPFFWEGRTTPRKKDLEFLPVVARSAMSTYKSDSE